LGGLAIFIGFSVTVLIAQVLPVPRFDDVEIIRLIGLLLGGALIFLVGLLDDLFELSYFWQFLGQIAARRGGLRQFHLLQP
jgi:UDP-GlcNAc:undecaprenyl-phosphate GlcNAc-1-phosphate transferase